MSADTLSSVHSPPSSDEWFFLKAEAWRGRILTVGMILPLFFTLAVGVALASVQLCVNWMSHQLLTCRGKVFLILGDRSEAPSDRTVKGIVVAFQNRVIRAVVDLVTCELLKK